MRRSLNFFHSDKDYSKGLVILFGVQFIKIHLLTALKGVCAHNADGNFDELCKDVQIENSNS